MRRTFLLGCVVALALVARLASAASVTITWDANPEPEVVGYVVSYGPHPGTYHGSLDVGTKTTCVLPNLAGGTYYIAVRAYNAYGEIGPYSTEVVAKVLLVSKPVPDTGSPIQKGESVTWTTEVEGATTPLEYQFWLLNQTTGKWSILRSWDGSNEAPWRPLETGRYLVQVWVRAVGSTSNYDAWRASDPVEVVEEPLKLTGVTLTPGETVGPGVPVEVAVSSTGGVEPIQYQFWVFNQKAAEWRVAQSYSTDDRLVWTPSATGEYTIQVWARSAGSSATYQAWRNSKPIQVVDGYVGLTSFTADPAGPVLAGTRVRLSAAVQSGTSNVLFKFLAFNSATRQWLVLKDYSTSRNVNWTPQDAGTYSFQVWVKQAGSPLPYQDWRSLGPYIVAKDLAVTSFTANVASPVTVDTPVTLTATTYAGADVEYQFWAFEATTRKWTVIRAYESSPSVVWTPEVPGTYYFQVWIRRAGSSASYEQWKALGPLVVKNSLTIASFGTLAVSPVRVWVPVTFTASVAGVSEAVEYKFWVYRKESKAWSVLQDYSPDGQVVWLPTEPGTYSFQVWVRRVGCIENYEAWSASGSLGVQP